VSKIIIKIIMIIYELCLHACKGIIVGLGWPLAFEDEAGRVMRLSPVGGWRA
jgi:hypothetical protein